MQHFLLSVTSLCCFLFLVVNTVLAQDTIVKKNNTIVIAKIIEIGIEEVKYKFFDAPDGPTVVISKADIKILKIKGKEDKMESVINNSMPEPENVQAPDIIIKKNGEQIKVKVIEIGPTQVKYTLYDAPNGPVIVAERREIKTIKIKGKGDRSYDVINNETDPMSISNTAIIDKTSAIKFNFFSPLAHHLAFSYEWMLKPGLNWETGLGIVGPGVSLIDQALNINSRGVFIRTGPKFLLGSSSDFAIEGARYAHPLKGRYFKIETIFYTLSRDYPVELTSINYNNNVIITPSHVNDDYLGLALNLIYGRQFIVSNSITIGYYVGLGYGVEGKQTTFTAKPLSNYDDYDPRRYSHYVGTKEFPISYTAGFNVGYIFKTPEWLNNLTAPKVSNKAPSRHSLKND